MAEWDGVIVNGKTVAQLTTELVWEGRTQGNKFAVGDMVWFKGDPHKIMGTNGENEYTLEGWAFLVWEDELTSIS